jgi:hypothetical protein
MLPDRDPHAKGKQSDLVREGLDAEEIVSGVSAISGLVFPTSHDSRDFLRTQNWCPNPGLSRRARDAQHYPEIPRMIPMLPFGRLLDKAS